MSDRLREAASEYVTRCPMCNSGTECQDDLCFQFRAALRGKQDVMVLEQDARIRDWHVRLDEAKWWREQTARFATTALSLKIMNERVECYEKAARTAQPDATAPACPVCGKDSSKPSPLCSAHIARELPPAAPPAQVLTYEQVVSAAIAAGIKTRLAENWTKFTAELNALLRSPASTSGKEPL